MRTTRSMSWGLMLVLVAGCSGVVTSGQSPSPDDPNPRAAQAGPHVMPMVGPFRADAATSAHLTYQGGPLLSNVKVVTVFWGSNVQLTTQLNTYYGAITNSQYFDWMSEYNQGSYKLGRGSFVTSYTDTGASTSTSLSDSTIQSRLTTLISQGKVPKPDANTYYAFHFPPGTSISMGGSSSCQQFCAYHGTTSAGVAYGVIPDIGSGGCQNGCGNTGSAFTDTTSVASHELIEAVTDPGVGQGNIGWYDNSQGEIGDICVGVLGKAAGYTIQKEWSNSKNKCVEGSEFGTPPPPPPPDMATPPPVDMGTPPPPPPPPPPGSCSHNICSQGTKLTSGCDACATKICAADSYCCANMWDGQCVSEVSSICGSGQCSTPPPGGNTCSHPICTTGGKLTSTCDPCATKVCAKDGYCCSTAWDSICKSEVGSICGTTCP